MMRILWHGPPLVGPPPPQPHNRPKTMTTTTTTTTTSVGDRQTRELSDPFSLQTSHICTSSHQNWTKGYLKFCSRSSSSSSAAAAAAERFADSSNSPSFRELHAWGSALGFVSRHGCCCCFFFFFFFFCWSSTILAASERARRYY